MNKDPGKDSENSPQEIEPVALDLPKIKERGYLNALVDNSTTSYFIYKGKPMGYEYELLERFCNEIGVELRITVTEDIAESFEKINKGEGDIAALNLTVTKERKKIVSFTDPLYFVRQVLVQKKPDNWRSMKLHEIDRELIRDPVELIGKEVVVRKSSAFTERLRNLSSEIGGDIIIIEDSGKTETEELIRQVSEGEIPFTVADEDVAMLNATYYQNVDVKTPISFSQQIAWAVRDTSDSLRNTVNRWLEKQQKTTDYYVIYNRYFKNLKTSARRAASEYVSFNSGNISPYDELIKTGAQRIDWDWRLLASLIYQESKFDPRAESWVGAEGLMQLMESTADQYGVSNLSDPKQSIKAGTKYLKWIQKSIAKFIPDSAEQIKFVLASYNVGLGHVEDARKLAEKYGEDPNVWEGSVAKYLELKSKEKYYTDPVVSFGYCRGTEPVHYVEEILYRYEQYKQLIKGDEVDAEAEESTPEESVVS